MSSTKRKSAILQNARSQHRGSVMLTPQQRLNNFKQTVSSANVAVSEKSQVVRQKISKNLEKRKKKLLNAQMLLQNLGEVSGINDTNLLYGEKPPMGDDNSLMMTDKPYLKDTTQGGVGAQDPNLKPKKDLRYKLKSFKRRTEQKVLETFGKSPQRKLKETEFDTMWEKVFTQEQVWRELKVRCKDLMKMMQNIGDLGSEISELLIELCKDDSDGSDDGSDNAGYQTLPLLKLQYSLDTIAKDTIPRVVDEQLNDTVCQPLTEWKDEFPSYQACLQKRDGLARDVDAYERKLQSLEDKPIDRRDPAEIARRKDQLMRAERRFKNFNKVLLQHFKEVDSQKHEKGQIIGDGILEAFRLWHETCSQLLPPAYTFDSARNTPRRESSFGSNLQTSLEMQQKTQEMSLDSKQNTQNPLQEEDSEDMEEK